MGAQSQIPSLYYDYNASYNFYIRDYERLLSKLPEEILPNVYVFLTEMNKRMRDPGGIIPGLPYAFPGSGVYNQHITLDGRIKKTLIDIVSATGEKTGELDQISYYETWTQILKDVEPVYPAGHIIPTDPIEVPEDHVGPLPEVVIPKDYFYIFPFLEKFDNLIVPMSSISYLLDYNEKRRMFPMYVEIDFNTDNNTQFADAFRKTKLGASLMQEVMENKEMYVSGLHTERGKGLVPEYEERPWNRWMRMDRVSSIDPTFAGMRDGYYRYWDIGQFLMTKASSALVTSPTITSPGGGKNWMYLYSPTDAELEEINNAANNCLASLSANLDSLRGWMTKKILGTNFSSGLARTYKEVYDGKQAYSETLFYRIEKKNPVTDEIIQNIWLPNSSEIDALKYVDTQVRYGVRYKYTVYAYQFVIGTKYRYKINNMPLCADGEYNIYSDDRGTAAINTDYIDTSVSLESLNQETLTGEPVGTAPYNAKDWITFINKTFNSNTYTEAVMGETPEIVSNDPQNALEYNKAEICVFSEPSLVLIEVPQFTFNTVIIDKPPVEPDVNLIPYRGISNKLLIFLNGSVGSYKAPFISMSEEDDDLSGKYVSNQKIPFWDGPNPPIEFKSDDPVNSFEIWRTDSKPTTWRDFKYHATADSSIYFSNPCQKASSASFKDDIKPNKKYWYTFRSVDVHGNKSNPTIVYEIIMHDDNGTVWLDIDTFPAPVAPDPRTPTKTGKKFIQIKPSFNQVVLDEKETGLVDQTTDKRVSSLSTFNFTSNPPVLGFQDQIGSIWSTETVPKKFKIRLTSKKTGRKMDLNISFKTGHIQNPSDKDC